jgi:glycosyltransferase involved in cell wall biosynthesis
MKILICNERFLSRFGVDRVLLLLGGRLRALGHHVVLLGLRFDENSRAIFGADVISVPTERTEYIDLNEQTARWLGSNWDRLFSVDPPGLAIVGGWPFYMALPVLRDRCPVVAMDFGAVPLDGFSGDALSVQQKLRGLRSQHLKSASVIVAISRFIGETQSRPDSNGRVRVEHLLLGADHIEESLWRHMGGSAASRVSPAHTVATLHRDGKRAILALGRWEPGCYKNSEAAFDLLRRVRTQIPDCTLLLLASLPDVSIPPDLQDFVLPVGFPNDRELAQLMAAVDIGVSVSLWEGFNLPLAEMQWLGRPALVFDCGAHPEVIADTWYLCRDLTEMADKAISILSTQIGTPVLPSHALGPFRRHFRWERVFREFLGLLSGLTGVTTLLGGARIIMDVTSATRDAANTGVIRVTRRLGQSLQHVAPPVPVVWDEQAARYVFPTSEEFDQLGRFNGPVPIGNLPRSSVEGRVPLADRLQDLRRDGPCCLLLTETIAASRFRAALVFAAAQGIPVAAVFYDAIPVLHPELCPDPLVRENHGAYMRLLAECDIVLPISEFSARCLEEYWHALALPGGPIQSVLLPGELGVLPRAQAVQEDSSADIQILCVSTLEPRKNHAVLLAACRLLDDRFPDLNWSLILVGNRYAGAFEIAEMVEEASRRDHRIRWLGILDDDELTAIYRRATFTVYPSLIEGFGMPVMESLWSGKPCICRNEGVMAELASGGGCLTVDVTNPSDLCDAIGQLATDGQLRRRLTEEARRRPITTWQEYAADLGTAVLAHCTNSVLPAARSSTTMPSSFPDWTEVLYPGCDLPNWQQENSERLAIAGVLARQRPRCSIEIGTYRGGSLSLIRQFSDIVFSIDIEPTIPDRFRDFHNVSFLTGSSHAILPILFHELDEAKVPVEFILVDGDHSERGVAQDIACILDYTPKAPLFVLFHDSFNPDCRRGMLTAPWARSPYVWWVDIDFVPGRLVENGSPFDGELWGGLAMAYLAPAPRAGGVTVRASAETMFQKLYQLQYRGQ